MFKPLTIRVLNRERSTKWASGRLSVLVLMLVLASQVGWQPHLRAAFPGVAGTIVYATNVAGDYDIHVFDPGTQSDAPLAAAPGDDLYPSWSPDGSKIVFTSQRNSIVDYTGTATDRIFVMDANGGNVRLLDDPPPSIIDILGTPTRIATHDAEPAWSPDGTQVVFRSDRSGSGLNIWVIPSDGSSGPSCLTCSLPYQGPFLGPAWSPDGSRIALSTYADPAAGGDGHQHIYTIDPRNPAAGLTPVTTDNADDYLPNWSPDGTMIAFQRNAAQAPQPLNFDIYVAAATPGSTARQLTSDPNFDTKPAWSPDGARIVFQSNRSGDFDLYTVDPTTPGSDTALFAHAGIDRLADWGPVVGHVTAAGVLARAVDSSGNPQPVTVALLGTLISPGTVTASVINPPPLLPVGFQPIAGTAYDIVTDAAYTGNIRVCIEGTFQPGDVILHNGAPVTPTTINASLTIACVDVSSLSPFVGGRKDTFSFTGFFSPVDNLPTVNVAKAGSAVPVKFSLGGYHGLDILGAGYPASQSMSCSSSLPTDQIEETVAAGMSSLSYDATSDQYVYVWKSDKAWAGSCRVLNVTLKDGTKHQANFRFTK